MCVPVSAHTLSVSRAVGHGSGLCDLSKSIRTILEFIILVIHPFSITHTFTVSAEWCWSLSRLTLCRGVVHPRWGADPSRGHIKDKQPFTLTFSYLNKPIRLSPKFMILDCGPFLKQGTVELPLPGRDTEYLILIWRRPLENDQVCIPSTCILFPITLTFHLHV